MAEGGCVIDLVIEGGLVADGTGAPARVADVAVEGERVVEVGEPGSLAGSARRRLDATGLVVMPGFVDLHTHYDAQLFWDPFASPSPLHGVTTVIGGNCGFSLAPAGEAHSGYLARMMARVEGMPLAALEAGLDWSWSSFADWLGRLEGRIAVNAGFLVGHSTVRRVVLGDDATEREATDEELDAMRSTVGRALREGALGFSSSRAHTHHDSEGRPVPSRRATERELLALSEEVGSHEGTTLELIVPGCLNGFTDEEVELLTEASLAGRRPLNWNVLGVSALNPDGAWRQLDASTRAAERGAVVVALTLPHTMRLRLSFLSGTILDGLPGWREVLALPLDERIRALADPAVRRRLDERAHSKEAGILGALANWKVLEIEETFAEENRRYEGRRVGEIAAERGQDPFDALLDVVVADGLRTGLRPPIPETEADWKLRAAVWRDPRTVVGGSDAGAHLDTMCGAIYTTALLGEAVRVRGLLGWEEAAHQLAEVPARLYGLVRRGRIAPGWFADLVVVDPASVGHGKERTRDDLPGGASRLYAEAHGVVAVFVNGRQVVDGSRFTGELPGRVLRSGRDTETVSLPEAGRHTGKAGTPR
jgi:N-acyl-D-aspartate/D-glutamate deacylase